MPIAGTSLLMMDPYITARSFSTPLSLLAIAFVLEEDLNLRNITLTALCLLIASAFHPLMACYAVIFVLVLQVTKLRRPMLAYASVTLLALAVAATLQAIAPPEPPAVQAAVMTRYYWFLSQWKWYELLGLAGPPAMLALLLIFRHRALSRPAITLCQTSTAVAAMAVFVALLFAHEGSSAHLLARLQILRIYLPVYAIMAMMIGSTLYQICEKSTHKILRASPVIVIAAMAAVMGVVQHLSFPNSDHVELPTRSNANPNPWVQAFLWAKQNTPNDALFALDAKYVNTDGEDAQTFRATALRSAIPDYSKDGGEASITPALASQWQVAAAAQKNLDQQPDSQRDANLKPFGVTWMVLRSTSITTHACPYDNHSIKICRLTP